MAMAPATSCGSRARISEAVTERDRCQLERTAGDLTFSVQHPGRAGPGWPRLDSAPFPPPTPAREAPSAEGACSKPPPIESPGSFVRRRYPTCDSDPCPLAASPVNSAEGGSWQENRNLLHARDAGRPAQVKPLAVLRKAAKGRSAPSIGRRMRRASVARFQSGDPSPKALDAPARWMEIHPRTLLDQCRNPADPLPARQGSRSGQAAPPGPGGNRLEVGQSSCCPDRARHYR